MSVTFKKLYIKNFMSVGAGGQCIDLNSSNLCLILGDNLDSGGNSSRNGAGKTTIVNALCYVLFGSAITNIRKDRLINLTNLKHMIVALDFEKDNKKYRIERGRKPNLFRFFVDDGLVDSPNTDEAQGENRFTQEEVNKVIGVGYEMFKHIVSLNTYTDPFLSLKAADQRQIIEELLGITLLSQKAEVLKDLSKMTRDNIREEEFRIKALIESNQRIESMIEDLVKKSDIWEEKKKNTIAKLETAIDNISHIDIDEEIKNHETLALYSELTDTYESLKKHRDTTLQYVTKNGDLLETYSGELDKAENSKCPTCGQAIHDEQNRILVETLNSKIVSLKDETNNRLEEYDNYDKEIKSIENNVLFLDSAPKTYYDHVGDAHNHKETLNRLKQDLDREMESENPETDNIKKMKEQGLQTVDYQNLNDLTSLKEHQDVLYRLLTNKDSFIRKKIIDQNLAYLNHQLGLYLDKLHLPHNVQFQNDLSVEITELGRELDFYNLSRGESNRLILGLSCAFRDVWESMNGRINLLFIDELIDNGLDSQGVESALAMLKKMSRDNNKHVFLISHREELISRVQNVMVVQKENGFTTFKDSVEVGLE